MEFAVVNTLDFMDHKMYESDPDLMKALNKIWFKWVKGKNGMTNTIIILSPKII